MSLDIYDSVIINEDINPVITKGLKGVVLLIHNNDSFEIEIFNEFGETICYNNQLTFTLNITQISKYNL